MTNSDMLHAELLQAISKEGKSYECITVKLGDVEVGRLFPRPLEMATIKATLGQQPQHS